MGRPMVKARLGDGRIVALGKDCDCVIHDGPHWLHMDAVDKRLNAPLRERALRGESIEVVRAYAQTEQQRLSAKRREMERQGIVEILS